MFTLKGVIQISENSYSCLPVIEVDDDINMKSVEFANILQITKSVINAYIDNILRLWKKDKTIAENKLDYIS